ncbi:MAG: SLBB domain-containing protein [Xenococcaceae cyanobacterium MO_167.B27]|nr:SLBB domain-containing protein [Xenococcaceae cyanobacterium MO_167.B27]
MKMTSILAQLSLNQSSKIAAITTALLFFIQPTSVKAELKTQDTRHLIPNEPIEQATGTTVAVSASETSYTLGPGDVLRLDIFQVPEYSGEFPVLVDGTVSLRLIGNVKVSGLTLNEASETVRQKYASYLKRPIVNVGLVSPRPLKIGIAGEVDNPGSYEFALGSSNQKFPTVTDMIEQAGGITTLADVRNVKVTRKIKGRDVVFYSNLWSLLTENRLDQDISLRDGDTILIPTVDEINSGELARLSDSSFGLQTDEPINVAVVGEIYRPGTHTVTPQQIGDEEQDSLPARLTQAIGVAGGIKPLADVRKVEIHRDTWDGQEKVFAVNLWELIQAGDENQDIILQEGDRIIIPQAESLSAEESEKIAEGVISPAQITVNVVGEVVNPGAQEVRPNTPLNQAILAAGGFDNRRADTGEVELVRLNDNGTVAKRTIKVDFAQGISEENNPVLRNNDVVVVSRSGLTKTTDTAGRIFSPLGGIFSILRFIGL